MSRYYIARIERNERVSWVSWWLLDGGYTEDLAAAGVFDELRPWHNDGSGAIAVGADVVERLADLFEVEGHRRLPNSPSVWLALRVAVIEQPRSRTGELVEPTIPALATMVDFVRRSIERRGRWVP